MSYTPHLVTDIQWISFVIYVLLQWKRASVVQNLVKLASSQGHSQSLPHTDLKWSTSFVSIENHHCPNKFGCCYSLCLFMEGWWMNGNLQLDRSIVWYCFIFCIPTCCSANCGTFSHRNSMSASLANVHMLTDKNWMQYCAVVSKPHPKLPK